MVIALSQRILYHKGRSYDSIDQSWYRYLNKQILITLHNRLDQNFDQIADMSDAYIITGGDDSKLRRTVELKLAARMLARGKPVIGVCHGCFLLTETMGGTVIDLPGHTDTEHDINYFGETIRVNSYHSLGITAAPEKAIVLANDQEGHCEAWIDGNTAGLVWHPERMTTPWIPDEIAALLAK
jgi:gamma-glutamyl-gamma-aminobutyrate hydrolase PuuD